jgi:YD repeat-containing protein
MLIRAFFAIIIILFNIGCNIYAQEEQSIVKGGYKECIVYKSEYKSGKLDSTSRFKELLCNYDSTGKKILQINYQPNGVFETKELRFYDGKGRIDTIKFFQRVDTTELASFEFYTYNDDGDLIEIAKASEDTRLIKEINPAKKASYKYNKKGNVVEKTSYQFDGTLDSKYQYKYDSKGNKTQELITNADRKVSSRITFKYNKNRNIIEKINFVEYGQKINQKYKYKYDELGNATEEIIYKNLKEPIEKREYIYLK